MKHILIIILAVGLVLPTLALANDLDLSIPSGSQFATLDTATPERVYNPIGHEDPIVPDATLRENWTFFLWFVFATFGMSQGN